MIEYAWSTALSAPDLQAVVELVDEAAAYDAEAGFSTATPLAPVAAGAAVRHLLVSMPPPGERGSPELDRLPDVRAVAYLRLDVEDGVGDVQCVVRPAFRSLGVATLLLERLAAESEGWSSVPGLLELRAWAHGAHPAADRMRRRFGATLDAAVFKTLRPVGGHRPFAGVGLESPVRRDVVGEPEVADQHLRTMAPDDRAVLARGTTCVGDPDSGDFVLVGVDAHQPAARPACLALLDGPGGSAPLRALLSHGLLDVQRQGARLAQLYVDALDEAAVAASRELDFVHDQSDLRYLLRLGG